MTFRQLKRLRNQKVIYSDKNKKYVCKIINIDL